jgi:dCMP deaminase
MMDAIRVATRSSCLVRMVGASLVRDNRVIASGYNGAPPGIKSCVDTGECFYQRVAFEDAKKRLGDYETLKELRKTLCIAVHAEVNALAQCALHGTSSKGATLYITNMPCPTCARNEILAKGVAEVRVWKPYLTNPLLTLDESTATTRLLEEGRVPVSYVSLSEERMKEIFSLMLSVGGRTSYKFQPESP